MLFVHFHTKKWPKVKDLNENLPPFLRQTSDCVAQLQPAPSFGQWGRERGPPGPHTAGSAIELSYLDEITHYLIFNIDQLNMSTAALRWLFRGV